MIHVDATDPAAMRGVLRGRQLRGEKFDAVVPIIAAAAPVQRPEAGFYLWLPVPGGDDALFTWRLNHELNTLVLPGSYLGRGGPSAGGRPNPGAGFVRIALVEDVEACIEGARRICSLLVA